MPVACARLREVKHPDGSTALDVIREQDRVLLEYREQIIECAAGLKQPKR